MATYTVQAPDGHTVTLQGPDGASHDDVVAQAQKLYQPKAGPEPGASSGSMVGDFLAGVGGNFAQHAVNAYDLLRKIPGADKILPDSTEFHKAIADATPDTTPAHVGKFVESAEEYMLPAGRAAKATTGMGLAARAGAQAATAGGVRAVQGGTPGEIADTAALGAAGPVVGDVVGAGVSALRNLNTSGAAGKAAVSLGKNVLGAISPRARYMTGAVSDAMDLKNALTKAPAALTPQEQSVISAMRGGESPAPANVLPPEQAASMLAEMNGPPAPTAAAPAPEVVPPASAPLVNGRASVAEQLREAMAPGVKPGEGGVATIAPEPAPSDLPDPKALKKAMRDLPPGTPNKIADANYAANQEPKQAGMVYEAAGRATKAQNLSQMLYDEGMTARKVAKWDGKAWEAAAKDRGMPLFSTESQGEVIDALKKLEKKVK